MQKMTAKQKREQLEKILPPAINIFGQRFEVVVTTLKGLYGDCDIVKHVIRIHAHQTEDQARRTLFHEAMHAAFGMAGMNEMIPENVEEGIVRMLENCFRNVINIDALAISDE